MAEKQYRPWNIDQQLLFPPSLRDWLPEDHVVYRVLEAVDVLDISAVTEEIEGKDPRGVRPYHPRMMVALLVYAYCSGVYSSRRIAAATYDSVPFRVLTGDEHPHFTVINEFRARNRSAVRDLALQVLRLCARAGLVDLEHVAVDGSKLEANASKHKAMSYKRMEQELKRLDGEFAKRLDIADQVDAEEDARYGAGRDAHELPDELKRRDARRKRIEQAKKELEQEAAQAREKLLRKRASELREKANTEADPVERKRKQTRARKADKQADKLAEQHSGDAGQPPQQDGQRHLPSHQVPTTPQGKPQPNAQRNFTDPDSRIMKRGGSYLQGYNCQCAVDEKNQIIVANAVTNQAPDQEHLIPVIEQVRQNLGQSPKHVTADAGYMSDENAAFCDSDGIDAYISVRRDRHGTIADTSADGGGPDKAAWVKMRAKLDSDQGRRIYRRRKATVEPVFGQIKGARGFRHFLLRGLDQVRHEWELVCLCHNLLKLVHLANGPFAAI